jgi:hypothetical protein
LRATSGRCCGGESQRLSGVMAGRFTTRTMCPSTSCTYSKERPTHLCTASVPLCTRSSPHIETTPQAFDLHTYRYYGDALVLWILQIWSLSRLSLLGLQMRTSTMSMLPYGNNRHTRHYVESWRRAIRTKRLSRLSRCCSTLDISCASVRHAPELDLIFLTPYGTCDWGVEDSCQHFSDYYRQLYTAHVRRSHLA